jgi:Cu(I)/Ag(I) efflux system membrane protein CusA/SilA
MVEKLISFSLKIELLFCLSACLFGWGIYSVQENPIDAIPDLSENQVIVFTEWMGSPQVIEDQVTSPFSF